MNIPERIIALLDNQHQHKYPDVGGFPHTPEEYVGHGYQNAIRDVLTVLRNHGIIKEFRIAHRTVTLAETDPAAVDQIREARDMLTKALRKLPRT